MSLSPTTPNHCPHPSPTLPWNNSPLLVLPPLILINGSLCQPASWVRCFATRVAQHTKPTIVYLVTNPVSSMVADIFAPSLCLGAVMFSLYGPVSSSMANFKHNLHPNWFVPSWAVTNEYFHHGFICALFWPLLDSSPQKSVENAHLQFCRGPIWHL